MKDLTSLKTYIIDSEDPHEVDDAISLEIQEGDIKNLWIHISNPCRLFLQDSNIDLDARRRNSSLYLTDQYTAMLPLEILQEANLSQNKICLRLGVALFMINLFVKEAKKPNESIYFNINISELFGIIFSRVSKEYLLK